ncbi:MAG: CocE/NonD family hydrolase [Methylocystaceae bacterium]|nr:CocE/NonD family hydrolase [Methylocystaceae bacterium]
MPFSSDFHNRIDTYETRRAVSYQLPDTPTSCYVTMRDGCKIAVDVYVPDGAPLGAKFPTLLLFTPYFRRFKLKAGSTEIPNPNTVKFSDYFVPRGYCVVVIDVRGTGASFGTRDGFRSPLERQDSVEITDWVIAQSWSNGVVGATGISYLGAASDFLASTGHPAVKAIAPLFSVWDTYADNYFPGGMQCISLTHIYDDLMKGLDQDKREYLKNYKYYASPDFEGPMPVDEDTDASLVAEAVAEHQSNFRQTDFMADLSYREEGLPYDPDYSSATISPYSYSKGVREDVAILSVSGWMDGAGYANGAIARFLTLDKNPRHLILGPWDHGARIDVSPWRKDETPSFSVLGCVLRFFDTYLMDTDTGLKDEPAVAYYKIHEEAWAEAESWPPQDHTLKLHPNDNAQLSQVQAKGILSYQATPETGTGFETRYERISGLDSRNYYFDWQGRSDLMLSWDSAPLVDDTVLAGHAILNLTASFDTLDAGLFVYLSEVEADGSERYITEGILRALFRSEAVTPDTIKINWPYRTYHRDSAKPLIIGKEQTIRIPFLPTAWTLSKGSRLRLSVAGGDKDHFKKVPHGKLPEITVNLAQTHLVLPLQESVEI